MLSALGHVLPVAVAVALSTVPVLATVVILLSPRRALTAAPFGLGWVLGLAVVAVGGALFGRALPPTRDHGREPVVGAVEVVIGVALLAVAVVGSRRNRRSRSTGGPPPGQGWLRRLGSLGPLACLGLGLALNLRPKGLLLGLAAGLAVAQGTEGPVDALVVLVVYVVIAASTVVGPVVATLVAPTRMEPLLRSVEDWIAANRATVTALIAVLMGFVVLGAGISRL